MRITARASDSKIRDLFSSITATKSRSWHKKLLSQIIEKIAKEHGFSEAKIGKDLQGIYMRHLDQTDESDISFLQRLARDVGAFIKPSGGKLLFLQREGMGIASMILDGKDISAYNLTVSERTKHLKVKAKWHNLNTGKTEEVSIGGGEPVHSIRNVYAVESLALSAAKAKYRQIKDGNEKLEIGCSG